MWRFSEVAPAQARTAKRVTGLPLAFMDARRTTMALKAIIHKANVQFADLDRQNYADYALTVARHPSETDERMLVRLLVFALNAPAEGGDTILELAKDMWEAEAPALWEKDLTGRITHWIDVGQPDERRLLRACGAAARVSVYSFASSTSQWWPTFAPKIEKARNLTVWQIPSEQSRAMAVLADRNMELNVTVQDGSIWVGNAVHSIEITPKRLMTGPS
jgi:uncharacterized protein YaeQ